ncbi:MAG: hypothetical protein ACQKBV_02295 [Puniceicoccales bacterium]
MKLTAIWRFWAVSGLGLAMLALAGCHSAQDFEYKGKTYNTLNAVSIDNREPYPITRDAWRLGLNREATIDGIPIYMGASEDGDVIRFKIERYYFGSKSAQLKQGTSISTSALRAIEGDLEAKGFTIDDIVAVYDMDTPFDFLPAANTIGYKPGMPPQVTGFYLISQPGAYDALLEAIAERPAPESAPAAEFENAES